MSWESSAAYYRLVNQGVRERLGGHHSARTLMLSVDFAAVERLQRAGDWAALGAMLAADARVLAAGGAGAILLCTNTMHEVHGPVEAAAGVPVLHIADAAGDAIRAAGLRRVGLLGTAFTMDRAFYRRRLEERHGIEVLVPEAADRATVHRIIYDELVRGTLLEASRDAYRGVIARLAAAGAEGVILGCTEIGLLVGSGDASVPLFDTAALHATAGVTWLLAG